MRAGKRVRNESVDTELLTRTSWVDAGVAYKQIKKGKADGNTCALWLRWHLQKYLFKIGCFLQLHCGKVLFLGLLSLSLCCIGLKEAKIETNVENLWVEEDGRLEEELKYTRNTVGEGTGTTSQLVVQTPKRGTNILTVESFQYHLETLRKVSEIEIDLFEVTWKFHDICYLPEFPEFESSLDQIVAEILPCVIVTPLDCFWDGAKLLGPDHAVYADIGLPPIMWTNLDPIGMVSYFKRQYPTMTGVQAMEDMMNKSGISTGYLEKPCLDPHESQCPRTAPNHDSGQAPDIGAELTNGCHGFAAKYMHWHEDLIVGGVTKNKTGHIVRAEALQSIIQLMGHQSLYDYWTNHYKTHSIDWTPDKAKAVLEAWQRKFTEVVKSSANGSVADDIYAFSATSLTDIMKEFSSVSVIRITFGYILMLFYACVSLLRWNNAVQSQSGIGIAGVILVALSVAAGLGICSLLGIVFNASTTQIVPFLALGLGVDDMFLIAHTYSENAMNKHIPLADQTGACLKRTGVSVLLTSVTNMLAFFSASIIPIPALRAFSLQAGILTFFNLVSVLLLFPAICSWDLIRKDNKRVDIFCCFQSYADTKDTVIELQPRPQSEYDSRQNDREDRSPPRYSVHPPTYSPSPPPSYSSVVMHQTVAQTDADGAHATTNLAPSSTNLPANEGVFVARPTPLCSVCPSTTSSQQCLTPNDDITCKEKFAHLQRRCLSSTLTTIARNMYAPFLKKSYVKVFSVLAFIIFLSICTFGATKVKDGLDLTDVVPKDTHEYKFLEAQSEYFGFYNVYMITKDGFDYPNGQRLLTQYHRSFQRIGSIVKREDGSLPNFWLDLFRQWLQDLQKAYDTEILDGRISKDRWNGNASDNGILAFKLLAQTGDVDNPVDITRIPSSRLIDSEGIISPDGFYNYLTAWVSNDALAYASSQADFHPRPSTWYHDPQDFDYKVPKAQPLVYTQLPFYLTDQSNTEIIINTIKAIRDICDDFADKGLPNYPSGEPFTYWEQYIHLRFYLAIAILCVLMVTFVVLTIVLMNPWLASIIVVFLTMMVVELFGIMGLGDIKLSAVPAVILIVSVGIGVEFTVHVSVAFLTAIGSRNKRTTVSIQHTFAPVIHGAISTLLGIVMLVGAEFEFIVKYFFNVLACLVIIGVLNGLLLLPVVLSLLGPPGEVRPKDNPDRLATPSPQASPKPKKKPVRATRSSRRLYPRVPSDISLTTITEEPTQYSSHEIVVEPEVLVETTTVPIDGRGASNNSSTSTSRNNTPPDSMASTPKAHHVTRVKATATVKVEVHTPIPGSVENVDHDHIYKSKRRKLRELDSSDSDSSTKMRVIGTSIVVLMQYFVQKKSFIYDSTKQYSNWLCE
ncbi:hypothetical protein FSP39_020198 [Pinctada imbricata]|uniref:SSD domain-containing protein n=1 Tax=Pinctada imbricata TaxID=66713 RepID=A0AA88Y2N0_PINIB|nr:hypothetical protein FSP39_020198 [Pinctada imbricata]